MKNLKKLTALMAAFIFALCFAIAKPQRVQAATTLTLEDNVLSDEGGSIHETIGDNEGLSLIRFTNVSDVTLVIKGKNKFKYIEFNGGNLTINGSGTLELNFVDDAALSVNNGKITINSGTINARANKGIFGDEIEINGGNVTAIGEPGVGIIAGRSITINGGTVFAQGGSAGLRANDGIAINGGDTQAKAAFNNGHAVVTGSGITLGKNVKEIDNKNIGATLAYDTGNLTGVSELTAHFIYEKPATTTTTKETTTKATESEQTTTPTTKPTENPETKSNNTGSAAALTTEKTTDKTNGTTAPNTGDNSLMLLLLGICSVSGAAAFILMNKKQESK